MCFIFSGKRKANSLLTFMYLVTEEYFLFCSSGPLLEQHNGTYSNLWLPAVAWTVLPIACLSVPEKARIVIVGIRNSCLMSETVGTGPHQGYEWRCQGLLEISSWGWTCSYSISGSSCGMRLQMYDLQRWFKCTNHFKTWRMSLYTIIYRVLSCYCRLSCIPLPQIYTLKWQALVPRLWLCLREIL